MEQAGILFNENIHHNEDVDFSRRLLYHFESIVWYDSPIYVWERFSCVSQSSSPIDGYVLRDLNAVILNMIKQPLMCFLFYENSTTFLAYLFVIYKSHFFMVNTAFLFIKRLEIQNRLFYFDHTSNKKVKITSIFIRLFGINFTGHLLAWVMKREETNKECLAQVRKIHEGF